MVFRSAKRFLRHFGRFFLEILTTKTPRIPSSLKETTHKAWCGWAEDEANDQTRVPKEALRDGVSGSRFFFVGKWLGKLNTKKPHLWLELKVNTYRYSGKSVSFRGYNTGNNSNCCDQRYLQRPFKVFANDWDPSFWWWSDSWDTDQQHWVYTKRSPWRSVPSLSSSSTKSLSTKPLSWTLRMMGSGEANLGETFETFGTHPNCQTVV